MRLSVLVGTRNRAVPLLRCIRSIMDQTTPPHEIVVLDDASDALEVRSLLEREGLSAVRVIRAPHPLGVGRGRNLLFGAATGDVFLFLDDDAYLEAPDFLTTLARELQSRPKAGIIAARIVDHRGETSRLLVPFPRRTRANERIVERAQPVAYYLGGAHAIRRQVYDQVGGYDDAFVWGEEELDLSFRAIKAGFEIHYVPGLTVHHRAGPPVLEGADGPGGELYHHVRNRFVLARKYLPWRYAAPYLAIWLARHAADAALNGDPRSLIRGLVAGMKATVSRDPLDPAALRYLRDNHGRLWY